MPEPQTFLRYRLRAETLCLGERIRGGVFRPCSPVFRYTSLSSALASALGTASPVHAVARFLRDNSDSNRIETLSFAPHDRGKLISVIPLQIEYFANVNAELFIAKTSDSALCPAMLQFSMGAMRSKGFGRCEIEFVAETTCVNPVRGRLCVRLPDTAEVRSVFGIRNVLAPNYGYLFSRTAAPSGAYLRSLFEGSTVVAYPVILDAQDKSV
jgi:hypothetical protein